MDRAIESVAILIDDGLTFRGKAKEVADLHGPAILTELPRRLHRATPAPPGFSAGERGLGAWLASWQFAIFEVMYQFRERALPILRRVAFGKYDWTQANAIELLIRLAAEGIDRDRTLADLTREMPKMRAEALDYVAGPLLEQAKSDPAIAAILHDLRHIERFVMAMAEVSSSEFS